MSIKKIGVIGAGTMGKGIAQVFAIYSYPVTLVDTDEELLKGAIKKLEKLTEPELWKKVSNNISISTDINELKDCDLVIEAIFEDLTAKEKIFRSLNDVCGKSSILATNTSSISINKLADTIDNPSRFIGMHFMNPPKVMKLVEIIRGKETSDDTVETITNLTNALDKIPAIVNDSPGFVSNRLLFALIGEALKLLETGIAAKEDIDTVMKYGMNHPMGPIKLADFIGLDICQNIMTVLYNDLKDERYRPPHILTSLVNEGKLGKKTGEGFYVYK
ncbi:MAG: 3-hydroxyacyl-CoA dehydrogenase family protein [Candidatus Anammoxibacter sp.]